ncbi:uncharacterized protein LOC108218044 isoform X2 [Daucus carota subsp. sativus]|uniref:uncharacterized protein LOC108218044 isoform X2 n=1 Tax=Daucus carota subsp. sativus TaxID=79200 RepID=UPI003082AF2F
MPWRMLEIRLKKGCHKFKQTPVAWSWHCGDWRTIKTQNPLSCPQEMATTRSSITRLLRAAFSHHPATKTLLRPHHNSHHPLHTFTPTSPLSFLRSRPSNLPISNFHLFSTSRPGLPRATESERPISSHLPASCTLPVAVVAFQCWVLYELYKKFLTRLGDGEGTKFKGSLPNLLREGHSLVVEGKITMNELPYLEYCFAATEVLSKPEELAAAMERNNYILAQKLKVAEEEKLKVTAEDKLNVEDGDKLNVSEETQNIEDEKQNVAVKEPEVMVDSDKILNDVTNRPEVKICPDGLVFEGRVTQSRGLTHTCEVLSAPMIKVVLAKFKGLTDALQEGCSIVVESSVKLIKHESKEEDESGKCVLVKVSGKEHHYSAAVFAKHNHEKYVPQNEVGESSG